MRNEIQAKLNILKGFQEYYGDVGNRGGWIEALEYVLGLMKAQEEREE